MSEKKTGRPTKRTPESEKTICDAIAAGTPLQVAAEMGGICKSTFYLWINASPEFMAAVKRATAEAECRLVQIISSAAQKHWQAAAWLLERHPKYRVRWARPSASLESQNQERPAPMTAPSVGSRPS